MENQTSNNPNEKNKNSKALLYTIIGVLVALNAGLLYMWQKAGNEKEKVTKELNTTSEELKVKEQALLDAEHLLEKLRVDSATLAAKNKELDADVLQKKNELAALVTKLRNSQNVSARQIADLNSRIAELNEKIAQLEKENVELKEVNAKLEEDRSRLESEKRDVETRNTQLSSENTKMRQRLLSESVKVEPLKKRWLTGKEAVTYKASDVESLKTSFTISENTNAEPGERIIYVKVTGPGGTTLTNPGNESGTFEFENNQSKYTYKITTIYDQTAKTVPASIWRPSTDLKPGSYTVELYCDGFKMGGASFSLK